MRAAARMQMDQHALQVAEQQRMESSRTKAEVAAASLEALTDAASGGGSGQRSARAKPVDRFRAGEEGWGPAR